MRLVRVSASAFLNSFVIVLTSNFSITISFYSNPEDVGISVFLLVIWYRVFDGLVTLTKS